MAGPDSARGRAPRLSFGEGLLTRALELIASKPQWQKALFPRHERASRWQIAQDVCVEVCIQEGCQEWIKDKVQRGLIAKDAGGRFQSTKQWGYNPLDIKLRELREGHDRCYEDLVMDETWRSWEDVPYEKRAKLRSRYPHHFTVHKFLNDTRTSRDSLTPSTAGPSRPSATPQFEPTPTPGPISKTARTSPTPPVPPKPLLPTRASFTPQTIKKEIIEVEDSPPRPTKPATATSIKRERSTDSDSSGDDIETSSSDESYDDPEPPLILPKPQVWPGSAPQATPARSATNAASSSQMTSARIASGSLLQKGGAGSPARFAPLASGRGASQEGNGDDEERPSNVDKVPRVRAVRKYLIGQRMQSGEVPLPSPEQLFKAARTNDISILLAALGPGEQKLYDRTKAEARLDLVVKLRTRLLVRALDQIVKSSTSPLQTWRDYAFFAEDYRLDGNDAMVTYQKLIDLIRRSGGTTSPSLEALLNWRSCRFRIVLTSNERHAQLGFFTIDQQNVERITLWQLMRRFQDRYQESVRQQSWRKTPQLAKRRRIESA